VSVEALKIVRKIIDLTSFLASFSNSHAQTCSLLPISIQFSVMSSPIIQTIQNRRTYGMSKENLSKPSKTEELME